MALQKGKQHRRAEQLERESELAKSLPGPMGEMHAKMADAIHDKMKRRGEWKFKTKRKMSASAARSKSKKGGAGKAAGGK